MKCPTCTAVDLVMTERQAIEFDYCPKCRGVWLTRGELDKMIEKSLQPANLPPSDERLLGRRHGEDHSERHSSHGSSGYRRKSWLSDIFD